MQGTVACRSDVASTTRQQVLQLQSSYATDSVAGAAAGALLLGRTSSARGIVYLKPRRQHIRGTIHTG